VSLQERTGDCAETSAEASVLPASSHIADALNMARILPHRARAVEDGVVATTSVLKY
jgi:hypothetical protein